MAFRLTLHPTAAAAAQALGEETGGPLLRGDSSRGFFAFALEMARRARPFRLADQAERLSLAWEAAQRARMELPISAAPAFARALSDLHGSGLTPAQLRRLGATPLAAALEAHQQLLSKMGLCEPSAVAWLAAEVAKSTSVADAIEVLPRSAWTQGELCWMEALGKRTQVTVYLPEEPELDPVHQELARAGSVRFAATPEAWGGFLSGAGQVPSSVAPGAVEAHNFGSATDEARGVVVRVRALLRAGVAPDSIAVTSLRDPAPEIFSALRSAGVAVGESRRSLIATAAGQLPLTVLAAAEEGVPRERLCELLEAGLLAGRHPLTWARRLREAGSGSHARGRLFPPLEALLRRKPELDQEGLAALQVAVERIASLPAQGTVRAHARALWQALSELKILEQLVALPSEKSRLAEKSHLPERYPAKARQLSLFGAAGAAEPAERPEDVEQGFEPPWVEVARIDRQMALDQVRETFDSLASLDVVGRSIGITEFAALVRDALSATPARSVTAVAGGVSVAPAAALAGRRFSHVLVTGLAGDGPPAQDDSFIPESLRRSAREMTERPAILPAAGPLAARAEERMSLALASGLAGETLWGSGFRSRQGKQLEPSRLLTDIARAAAAGMQIHPLRPSPVDGFDALSRDELCAALPDAPAVRKAEPERTLLHRGLASQRLARERAILEGRVDAFAGDLTAPDVVAGLATRLSFDEERPLSASTLDRLAGCGFRALAEVVLHLREPDEIDEAIDSRRRGTFVHACLQRAFTKLKASGLLPLQGGDRDAEEREVFLAGAREELAAREASGESGHPVVWAGQRSAIERQLLRLLEAEQRSKTGFVPDAFEVEFGVDRPLQRLRIDGKKIALGGTADRIDRGPAGSLRVVDYKTGGGLERRNKRFGREFAGRDLQLGHYALILKLELPQASVEANYFSTYQAGFSRSLAVVCQRAGLDIAAFLDATAEGRATANAFERDNLPNLIETHVRRARAGEFPVEPGDCEYCRLRAGCRVGGLFEEWE